MTASSPEIISICRELAERGHDVRVTIWDAPEYLTKNLRLSYWCRRRVSEDFVSLLKHARSASVVSDEMRSIYERQFPNLPIQILRHGTSPLAPVVRSNSDHQIRFVFAGSLYSKNEWNAFIRALNRAEWHLANKEVRLTFLGRFPRRGAIRHSRVEHRPPISHDEALHVMTEMDVGYLPYWLDPAHEFVARTSFPGKMTAYTAAGLSVFHHGPATSSVTRFLNLYPYGVSCDSLDSAVILTKLEQLAVNAGRKMYDRARRRALEEELSSEVMAESFRRLINPSITADDLAV